MSVAKKARVALSLEAALRHLRLLNPRTMWIDAICINQLNIKERGSQVGCMRDIYRQSVMTVIWLGDETPESKSAFEATRNCITTDNFDDDISLT